LITISRTHRSIGIDGRPNSSARASYAATTWPSSAGSASSTSIAAKSTGNTTGNPIEQALHLRPHKLDELLADVAEPGCAARGARAARCSIRPHRPQTIDLQNKFSPSNRTESPTISQDVANESPR